MTVYSAPVKDMMFLFEHLKDNKNYNEIEKYKEVTSCLLYTSPSPRDYTRSRMPSSA